jgi:hypothetical protein
MYLEKDVGRWLAPHQFPQQVHCLKYNFDPILENSGPNCKSENACYHQRSSWQCRFPPSQTHQSEESGIVSYLQGIEVLPASQSEFCHSARAHYGVWSLKMRVSL